MAVMIHCHRCLEVRDILLVGKVVDFFFYHCFAGLIVLMREERCTSWLDNMNRFLLEMSGLAWIEDVGSKKCFKVS